MNFDLSRRLAAEALGTFFLVMAVVGSGIMAEKLAGGNEAIALLCNTLADRRRARSSSSPSSFPSPARISIRP